ncbi:MAG: DUF1499 domain-containing protein [Gemmatimonadota bacterium]
MMSRLIRALTRNQAQTHPAARDPRLRGRRYAIPFDRVWNVATLLADQGLPGWRVTSWNDREGLIKAEARAGVFRWTDEVTIRITLDENAQTRVDLTSRSKVGKADFGMNARRIETFLRELDQRLEAAPDEILETSAGRPQRSGSSSSIGLRA